MMIQSIPNLNAWKKKQNIDGLRKSQTVRDFVDNNK